MPQQPRRPRRFVPNRRSETIRATDLASGGELEQGSAGRNLGVVEIRCKTDNSEVRSAAEDSASVALSFPLNSDGSRVKHDPTPLLRSISDDPLRTSERRSGTKEVSDRAGRYQFGRRNSLRLPGGLRSHVCGVAINRLH